MTCRYPMMAAPDEPLPLVFSVVLAAQVARLAPIIRHQKCHFPSHPLHKMLTHLCPWPFLWHQHKTHHTILAPCNPQFDNKICIYFLVTQLLHKIFIHQMSHCHWSSLWCWQHESLQGAKRGRSCGYATENARGSGELKFCGEDGKESDIFDV